MAPLLGILKPQLPVITLQTPNHRLRQVEMKAYRLTPSPKQYIISLGCLSWRRFSQDTCMCMGGVSIYQPLSLVWTSTIYTCTTFSISVFLSQPHERHQHPPKGPLRSCWSVKPSQQCQQTHMTSTHSNQYKHQTMFARFRWPSHKSKKTSTHPNFESYR